MDTTLDVTTLSLEGLVGREWLATNALGGYACSTVPCLNTRKYHGLLVAAMAPPVKRMVLLSRVEETLYHDGWPLPLACNEYPGTIHPEGHRFLRAFSREPFPRWAYQGDGWTLVKALHLLRGQNTVCLAYTLLGGGRALDMDLRPLLAMRGIHDLMYQWQGRLAVEDLPPAPDRQGRVFAYHQARGHRVPATGRTPEVFFAHDGAFDPQATWYFNTIYRREQERGYAGLEDLWMPGVLKYRLTPGRAVYFACSSDPIDLERVLEQVRAVQEAADAPAAVRSRAPAAGAPAEDATFAALSRAADQFVAGIRKEGAAEETVAVISQYPWSAPCGRDALVAFAGLFLTTRRYDEGRRLLLALAAKMRRGLVPSEFTEAAGEPVYHGADVSLWFVHAVHQYFRHTADDATLRRQLFTAVLDVIRHYRGGTDLGIATDQDGLVTTHEPAVGTTWMDARSGDWVITPRHGRPVEVNALWYNALRAAAELSEHLGEADGAAELSAVAATVKGAFNRRFWNEELFCCYDVVGDDWRDASVRPNQLLAASLPFPVLEIDRHEIVLEWVTSTLQTPFGVRTLAGDDPAYQPHYGGNVVARDRAQHNGSAFPWLLGPLADTYARVHGRGGAARAAIKEMLRPCIEYLGGEGMGQLCELFDGNPPHHPGGAIASAPAVAEVLRAYAQHVMDEPAPRAPALEMTVSDLSAISPAPPAPQP